LESPRRIQTSGFKLACVRDPGVRAGPDLGFKHDITVFELAVGHAVRPKPHLGFSELLRHPRRISFQALVQTLRAHFVVASLVILH
jgi:hypothetical protein